MALTVVKTSALSGTITNAQLAGSIDLTAKVTGSLPTANGGTGSTATTFVNAASNVTGTLPTGNGGTGATTFAPGKILQVVGMRINTQVQNNTETYADTGVTLNITPSATSSKIIVMCTINGIIKMAGSASNGLILQLLRDSTSLVGGLYTGYDGVNVNRYMSSIAVNHLDSPSSTSALTYKMQFKNNAGATGVQVQANGVPYSSIVLMEVGA